MCKKCKLLQINNNKKNIIIPRNKLCYLCSQEKKADEFYYNPTSHDGLFAQCSVCYNKEKNREKIVSLSNYSYIILNKFKKRYSKRKFDITVDDIVRLWHQQNGLCYITNHPMETGKDNKGNIDHIWNMTL